MNQNKSELTNELAKALAEAQKHISEPIKDKKGNFGTYASLASLRRAVLPALNERGIAVVQMLGFDEANEYLETTLLHSSGQWISSRMKLKIEKPSMQGTGSAITYACRYSLEALAAAGEDDDGSKAEEFAPKELAPQPRTAAPLANTSRHYDPLPSTTSGEYKVAIPKTRYLGKTLDEIGAITVKKELEYWTKRVAGDGKPAGGAVKDFLDHASVWLKAHIITTKPTQAEEEPPMFDDIPF